MKKTELKAWFANKKNRQGVAVVGFCALLLAGGISYATLSHTPQEPAQVEEQTEPQQASFADTFSTDKAKETLETLLKDKAELSLEDVSLVGKTLVVEVKEAEGVDATTSLNLATKTGTEYVANLNAQNNVPERLTWIEKNSASETNLAYTIKTESVPTTEGTKPQDVLTQADAYTLSHDVHVQIKDNLPEQTKGVVLNKDKEPVVAKDAEAPKEEDVKAEEQEVTAEEEKAQQEPAKSTSNNTTQASDAPTTNNNQSSASPQTNAKSGHYEKRLVTAAWDEPIYETRTRTVEVTPARTEQRKTGVKYVFVDGHEEYDVNSAANYSVQLAKTGVTNVGYKPTLIYETVTIPAVTRTETYQVQTGSIHHDAVYQDVWVED